MTDSRCSMHIINTKTGEMVERKILHFVPRVGDEIRTSRGFYKVAYVVWAYDENDHPFERANIGVVEL